MVLYTTTNYCLILLTITCYHQLQHIGTTTTAATTEAIMEELLTTEYLSPDNSWTIQILTAMTHWCPFQDHLSTLLANALRYIWHLFTQRQY